MPYLVVLNRIRQRLHDVALTNDVSEILRAISTVKRGHPMSLPATRGRVARGG